MSSLAIIESSTDGFLLPSFPRLIEAGIAAKRIRYPLPGKRFSDRLRKLFGESEASSTLRTLLRRKALDASTLIYPVSPAIYSELSESAAHLGLNLSECLGPAHPVAEAPAGMETNLRHRLADRKWTLLIAEPLGEFHTLMIDALQRARPDTEVTAVSPAEIGRCPIDWMLTSGSDEEVARALSCGIPVAAPALTPAADMIDDDCGLLLAPDTSAEEFVMGIAPWLDSDIRSARISEEARSRWNHNYNATALAPVLTDKLIALCRR